MCAVFTETTKSFHETYEIKISFEAIKPLKILNKKLYDMNSNQIKR